MRWTPRSSCCGFGSHITSVSTRTWIYPEDGHNLKEATASHAGFTSYAEAVATAACHNATYLEFPSEAPSDLSCDSDLEDYERVCAFSASDDPDDTHAEGAFLSASLLREILSPDILAVVLAQFSNVDFWRQSRTLRLVCTALRDASYAHAALLRVVNVSSHKLALPRWASHDALRYSSFLYRAATLPDGTLCLCYEKELQFFAPTGSLIGTIRVPGRPRCIVGMGQIVFVGFDVSVSAILLHSVAPMGLSAGLYLSAGPLELRHNVLVDIWPVSLAVDGRRLYVGCGTSLWRPHPVLTYVVQHDGDQLALQQLPGFRCFDGDGLDGWVHSVSVPSKECLVIHFGTKILFSEGLRRHDPVVRSRVIELNVPLYDHALPSLYDVDTEVVACDDYIFITRKDKRLVDIFRASDGKLVQQGNFAEGFEAWRPLCLVTDQRQSALAPYAQPARRVHVIDGSGVQDVFTLSFR